MAPISHHAIAAADITGPTTDTERAVLGMESAEQALTLFSDYTADHLRSPITSVTFRAGRIDVVWGVHLADGRDVVIKAHRGPVDLAAVTAATRAKYVLNQAGFPCPTPLSGPDEVTGRVLVAEEAITDGNAPDGRAPGIRPLLAQGLASHIQALRAHPELAEPAGKGPAWCQYQNGPWPTPHDPIVDFTTTPADYAWLDDFAYQASEQALAHQEDEVVVAHADWYAGNTAVADGALVGTFDWELVAGPESVIAGIMAAAYASSSTSGGGLSSPAEVAGFLADYEHARGAALSGAARRAAAAGAAWVVAFNARWEVSLRDGRGEGPSTELVRQYGQGYLDLDW